MKNQIIKKHIILVIIILITNILLGLISYMYQAGYQPEDLINYINSQKAKIYSLHLNFMKTCMKYQCFS